MPESSAVVLETPREDAADQPLWHDDFGPVDTFARRHIGPDDAAVSAMLAAIGLSSLDELIEQAVPKAIRLKRPLKLPAGRGESRLLNDLKAIAAKNKVARSLIGMGYYGTITPPVVLRNVLENPGWYTAYTPYQAEISQGRLEALLNFQTMVSELTGLPVANASLLDEATAAAEAMAMCRAASPDKRVFVVSDAVHPQTIGVLRTRCASLGVECLVTDLGEIDRPRRHTMRVMNRNFVVQGNGSAAGQTDAPATPDWSTVCGVLAQYPTTDGRLVDHAALAGKVKASGGTFVVAADLLSLCLLKPPGEFGADVVIGSAQRFGVPMGFGGPHAAFLATTQAHARKIPGRLVGVSRDARGNVAYRLALQTREQHIRREKATSNICTAQVLLAVMAGMYGVYHGPEGLRKIARRVHAHTKRLAEALRRAGCDVAEGAFFDTIRVTPPRGRTSADVRASAEKANLVLRDFADGSFGVSLDERTDLAEVEALVSLFGGKSSDVRASAAETDGSVDSAFARGSDFMTQPVFNTHHSETRMLRYLHGLQTKDFSLVHGMIPLGSCTMKLNATSEMIPVSWPAFADLHPYAPASHAKGYARLTKDLEKWLAEITGFAAVSLQPNAGSQGEYAGLLAIRRLHAGRGESHRNVCLIPVSAHGTNPSSAVVAGFRVVPVACRANGDIDVEDLKAKAAGHRDVLAALMVTYPSTHGVFEAGIKDVCRIVHDAGGRVYLDGANLNALVGLARPGDFGADVCHLNLHKTFCIPHGGGGPGVGPIGVTRELAAFLPGDPTDPDGGVVSAAPYGSASILPISWVYIALMGGVGLTHATKIAILNANYMAERLKGHYPLLYTGTNGRVAHEFILDCRPFEKSAGVKVEDLAKRLMDYGFHAPTMSWPVPGTLMVEPTESEDLAELDRFVGAMIGIREEIAKVERGEWPRDDNPLKHAPHPADAVTASDWSHPYTRDEAAFPLASVRSGKFWPAVARIDNPFGDRHLVCTCPDVSAYDGASSSTFQAVRTGGAK